LITINNNNEDYQFVVACKSDTIEIMEIFEGAKSVEGCSWNENYPTVDVVTEDLNNNVAYKMTIHNKIAAVITIDGGNYEIESSRAWQLSKHCYFWRMAVSSDSLKNGIGTITLKAALKTAENLGYKSARILVADYNTPALALYTKFGFVKCDEMNEWGINFYCMERGLTYNDENL